jgi:hypothetical protein
VGVKVTPSLGVPALGAVADAVQEKAPDTEAKPPLSVDEASVWPYVIALAVGHAVTAGVVLVIVVVPPPPPPHPAIHKPARRLSQIAGCRRILFITQPPSYIFSFSIGIRSHLLSPG